MACNKPIGGQMTCFEEARQKLKCLWPQSRR